MKILAVYPPGTWRRFVRQVLVNDGRVVECVDGASSSQFKIRDGAYDVALVDGELRDDSWKIVVQRALGKKLPVVVHSNNDAKRRDIEQAGATFGFKNDSPQQLLETLERLASESPSN